VKTGGVADQAAHILAEFETYAPPNWRGTLNVSWHIGMATYEALVKEIVDAEAVIPAELAAYSLEFAELYVKEVCEREEWRAALLCAWGEDGNALWGIPMVCVDDPDYTICLVVEYRGE
jgi:hypothetical protein